MIPFPALTAWSLVAAAAIAAAAPPSLWWLALIPLTVAWLGLLARHPARPPVEHTDLRVWLDLDLGSMYLDGGREPGQPWRTQDAPMAAWAARYPYAVHPVGGWNSGACDGDYGGWWWDSPPPPRPRPYVNLEHLERLADTAELRALR